MSGFVHIIHIWLDKYGNEGKFNYREAGKYYQPSYLTG